MLLSTEKKGEPDEHAPNTSVLPSGSALGAGGHHPGRLAQVNKQNTFSIHCAKNCNLNI